MNTSKRLDELLKQRKMSLKELSRRSGVSCSTLYSARQRDGQLSVDTIELLCKELGIRPFEFYMTDEDRAMFQFGYRNGREDTSPHAIQWR